MATEQTINTQAVKGVSVTLDVEGMFYGYDAVTMATLNVDRSVTRYVELVTAKLGEWYPGAKINVSTVPVAVRTEIHVDAADSDRQYEIETDERQSIEDMLSRIYNDGEWYVERA